MMLLTAVLLAGCAVRLGGPKPEPYQTLAMAVSDAPAAEVGAEIRRLGASLVLLSAAGDSTWFADVARAAGLELSGPGAAGPVSLAFLGWKPLGDTTVALPVAGGPPIIVHDALYRVDKNRYLDLMAVRIEPGIAERDVVRALLSYVATDVMSDAAVILALEAPDPDAAGRIAGLLGPAFSDTWDCMSARESSDASPPPPRMRLFYGPELRIRCEGARVLDGGAAPILGRLVVQK